MAISYPPIFINKYLSERIAAVMPTQYFSGLRFFPTSPTDLSALTESFPDAANDVFAVYDRMFKMRRSPFPNVKSEQLLYYFYKTAGDIESLIETTQVVYDLLDRSDESAIDINAWIKSKISGTTTVKNAATGEDETYSKVTFDGKDFLVPFFHDIKVYQLEETRDIIDFGTARTYAGNKIIIDYNWHSSPKIG